MEEVCKLGELFSMWKPVKCYVLSQGPKGPPGLTAEDLELL